ncbi:MAG: preprotein translocase subunit SecY [Micrococcales bacterium]|nr:preprotein translocase subunit SecY [Micrococcales bacterium]
MLSGFVRAFRTPDLRRKLLFTIGIMVVFRVGSFLPAPGINYANVQHCVQAEEAGLLTTISMFSGGALLQLAVFALGIMPYITASIIVQLLRVVIPRFEALHKEGQSGTAKLTQYTRYLTIGLAVLQSTSIIVTVRSGNFFSTCDRGHEIMSDGSPVTVLIMIIAMTTGTGLIMWLGELITEHGVGNGMSLLIFTSIAAGFPSAMYSIAGGSDGMTKLAIILCIIFVVIGMVVFVEQSQRRIPVQYAKRMVGRRMYGGTSTYIPIKINIAGVIPIIFAASLLQVPSVIVQFANNDSGWVKWVARNLVQSSSTLHLALYAGLIIFFAFFYTAITFNPDEVADNMKSYGGFVPGIRAGRPTAEYLDYVITRITTPGSMYLAIVALIPTIAFNIMGVGQGIPFGGSSILIIVGVGLETVKQIQSQLEQRHYEGFLR